MKSILTILCLCFSGFLFALEISEDGRKEANLFNTYLEAIWVHSDNAEKSFSTLQKALKFSPNSKYLRRLLVAFAVKMKKPDLAKPYVDYIHEGENEAEDWIVYAAYLMAQNNLAESVNAYEKAVEMSPDDMEMLYQYLMVLSVTDSNKMMAKLEKTAQEQPSVASSIYTKLATFSLHQNNVTQALAYLDQAVKAAPNEPTPRLLKAEIYEQTSQFFLMLHEFEELEKMGYANAGILSRMGTVFMTVQDLPKAKSYFLKAKQADWNDTVANYYLSIMAEQQKDYELAISYVRDCEDFNKNASRWLKITFLEYKLNRLHKSLQTLTEAHKRFKDNVEVGFFYGLLLNHNHQYKKANRVLKQVLALRPDYLEARLQQAYSLEKLKKYTDMEKNIRFILDKQPNDTDALNLLAYSLAQRGERLEEAEQLIMRALVVSPQDISFLDTLGWVYIKQGKLDEADDVFSSITDEIVIQHPEISYHKGVLREKQGRMQEALMYLEKARSGWPAADKLYKKLAHTK